MTYKKDLCLGRIISTPRFENVEEMKFVVALPPEETIREHGWIMLCAMDWGRALYDWEVQHGHLYINCYTRKKMEKEKFFNCQMLDCLSDEKIEEMTDAFELAEFRREIEKLQG